MTKQQPAPQQKEDFLHVPYGKTVHGEEEIAAVVEVLRTSTQMGKNVRAMEEQVAALFGKKFGVMVNSGSSSLYLAVEALQLPKGCEVITPALTFSTTVGCIVKNGLIPSFVDCDPRTFCIDVDKIEAAITPNTKAMVIPNLLGNIPDWKRIGEIAKKHGLKVVEDSADTLGGEFQGQPSGAYSDISITSFYGSHVINCAGNGGMLTTSDPAIADRVKLLRSWGRSSSLFVESERIENRFDIDVEGIEYDKKFVFETIGYNLEPNEAGAAFGLVQLRKLQDNIDKRVKFFDQQMAFFKKHERFFELPYQRDDVRTGWLAFPVVVKADAPFTRRELQIFLEKRNIQTRVIFTGNILRQPGFKDIACKGKANDFVGADKVMKGGMLLACHHGLTDPMIDHIQESVDIFISQYQ